MAARRSRSVAGTADSWGVSPGSHLTSSPSGRDGPLGGEPSR